MAAQIKILIVDDEAPLRDLVSEQLQASGYECSVAADGLEALALLKKETFSIIITDMCMPNMNGMQLMEKVNQISPEIPVIVMTGYNDLYSFTDTITAGANDYLAKPFTAQELQAKLKRILRERNLINNLNQEITTRNLVQIELRRQHGLLANIIEAVKHPLYVIDAADYTIKLANKACGFGAIGPNSHCYELTHHRDSPCNLTEHPCPLVEIKKTKLPLVVEHIHTDANGDPQHVELHAFPILNVNGEVQQMIEYAVDISARKRIIQELDNAKTAADHANRMKGEFLANMSHEIRTPMNAILGMNRLALDCCQDEEQRRYLETVRQSTKSLLSLINDILDFSKIEAGKIVLEERPFRLDAVIQEVLQTMLGKAEEKGLDLSYHLPDDLNPPPPLIGDELRLRQILLNLISNAIKFTETGDVRIGLEIKSQKSQEIALQFSVKDSGIGLPREVQERIFDKFSQSDNSISRKFGGTGLGLAISKKLTELMGGNIWVESEEGQGSTFFFTVLYKKGKERMPDQKVPEDHKVLSLPPLHILLVEDNLFNLDLARIVLEQAGHHVTTAGNGLLALERLTQEQFQVILMDVQMPELDGIETTRLIRQCENGVDTGVDTGDQSYAALLHEISRRLKGTRTPIVAMTAHAMSDDRAKCIDAGMDDYATKPFDPDELFAVIAKVTGLGVYHKEQVQDTLTLSNERRTGSDKPLLILEVKKNLTESYKLSATEVDSLLQTTGKTLKEEIIKAEKAIRGKNMVALSHAARALKAALHDIKLYDLADLAHKTELRHVRADEKLTDGLLEQLTVLKKRLGPLLEITIDN